MKRLLCRGVATALMMGCALDGAAAQGGGAISPARDAELTRMLAPSPQRELYRAWGRCLGNIVAMMAPQDRTAGEIQSFGFAACAEEESRLTGRLVREFGYDRGSAAMRDMRVLFVQAIARRVARGNNPARPANYVETTEEGWEVLRGGPHHCGAHLVGGSLLTGQTSAGIRVTGEEVLLIFAVPGRTAAQEARQYPANAQLRVVLNKFVGNGATPVGTATLSIVPDPEGISYTTPFTAELIARLADADAVQFWASSEDDPTSSRTFDVRGWAPALAAARRCVARTR